MAEPLSLFATCLVEAFYPRVGQAVVEVLERLGHDVDLPPEQTCCGLPLYNSGFHDEAAKVAAHAIRALAGTRRVVVPSGSCAWMMRVAYPELVPEGGRALAERVVEFTEVVEQANVTARALPGASATYHASCHLERALGGAGRPERVLARIEGLARCPMQGQATCCGFGGTFAVRYPEVSGALLDEKLDHAAKTGAEKLVVTDPGCMLHLDGGAHRRGSGPKVVHLAELLLESGVGK